MPDFKLSVSRLDNGVPTAWNTYVKGFSKATITINDATGGIGSSVKSYSITGGGINTTNASATTEKLNTVGDVVFTAIVTDSRGRSKKKTVTVNVKDYYAPSLNVLNVERCNADGSANTAGTNIKVKVSYGIASVDNKNYIANKSVSCNGVTNTSFENNKEFILQANCSPATQYTVTTIIKDALGKTASVTNQVRTDTRVMNIKKNKKAIAFGGFAGADNTAKSYWDLYATQYFNLDGTKKVLFNDELKWENIIGKPGTFSPKNHSHNYASSIGSMRSETNGIVKFYNDASNANASTNPFATIQREGTYTTFTNNDASTGSRVQLKLGNGRRVYLADSSFTPDSASNGLVNLGGSSGKWNQVWATNGTIQTSDENTKQNIRTPDEIYYKLAENIELVQYQFKETNQDDNIGRTHIGAISQQVEKAMNDLGLTGKDFAGFCKDKKQIVDVDENGVETYEAIDNEFNYALRYGELAMLKIWYLEEKLKKQQIEIDELKEKVEMLMK